MFRPIFAIAFALFLFTVWLASAQQQPSEADTLKKIRESLNVNMFSSPEYPAVFGIIAGISILLIVAVTFIVVGLFSMEPAKDSIIYRMTNTRMKKD